MEKEDKLIAQIPKNQQGRVAVWYNKTKKGLHDEMALALTIKAVLERKIEGDYWGYCQRTYEGIYHQRQLERHKELKKQEPMNIGTILAKLAEGEK